MKKKKEYTKIHTEIKEDLEKELKSLSGIRYRKLIIERAYEFAINNIDKFKEGLSLSDLHTREEVKKLVKERKI